MTFRHNRASKRMNRRTYATFAMVFRWLAAHDWQGLCCELLYSKSAARFKTDNFCV